VVDVERDVSSAKRGEGVILVSLVWNLARLRFAMEPHSQADSLHCFNGILPMHSLKGVVRVRHGD